jgi:hypothetical protein
MKQSLICSCHKETIQIRAPGKSTGTSFMAVIPSSKWMKMPSVKGNGNKSAVV